MVRIFLLLNICLLFSGAAMAQLKVDSRNSGNPEELVKGLFAGGGVDIRNIVYKGSPATAWPSIGSFDGTDSNIGIDSGLLITTGSIFDAPGPNTMPWCTSIISWDGDPELENLVGGKTKDATVLEFDFIPVSRKIEFRYVFASEEYEEFVCSEFNDAFAFLVSGPGISGKKNIARVPGTSDIVSINTVNNGCKNSKLDTRPFCDSLAGPCYPRNKYSFVSNEDGRSVEYDGFTKVFNAILTGLVPGGTYHMKIVIGDVGDNLWDSGVFLEGKSFKSNYILEFTPACFNDIIYFWTDATGDASYYKWDFGDGNNSFQESPSHMYTQPGNYKVQLFLEMPDGVTRDTLVRFITVNDAKANFSYKNDLNDWAVFNFTDISTVENGRIVKWDWDFGDGNNSPIQSPSHKYSADGNYTVRLIITTDNGCTDTVRKDVRFSTKFIDANSVCINDSSFFKLFTLQNVVSYKWYFGDGDSSVLAEPAHLYKSAGSYIARVEVVDDRNQSDTIEKMINVSDISADFEFTVDYTKNGVVGFTDKSVASFDSILSYYWNFGDGEVSRESSPSHTFSDIMAYKVTLVVMSENGCRDTVSKIVNLVQNNFGVTGFCTGEPVYFNITSKWPDYSAEWDFGDGNNSFEKLPVHYYLNAGNYSIRLILTDNKTSSKDTLTKFLSVYGIEAGFDFETYGGNNPKLKFSDNSKAYGDNIINWEWDFGDGNNSVEQNPEYRYRNEGTYTVRLVVTGEHGCKDTSVTIIDISRITNRIVTSEECAGIPCDFRIEGKWNITSCKWGFGDGSSAQSLTATHIYASGGDYTVTALIENDKSQTDSLLYVMRIDEVNAGFETSRDKSFSRLIRFTDYSSSLYSGIVSWLWDFGDGTFSKVQNPEHEFAETQDKVITLIVVNENGCIDTLTRYLNDIEAIQNCAGDICDFRYNTFWKNTSCEWDFGDGETSVEKYPGHVYKLPGRYNVSVIVKNTDTQETDTISQPIDISGVDAEFDYDSIAGAFLYKFSDKTSVVNGVVNNWYWNFGDGSTSREQSPSHVYSGYGRYKVTFIVTTDLGCRDTIFKIINNYGEASCIVSIPDTCMYIGDSLRLPLVLEYSRYLDANKNYQFEAKIRFNKSLLLPLQSIPFDYSFDGNDCVVTIKGNRNDDMLEFQGKEVLAWLELFVLWGSYEEIDIEIESFTWTDGYESEVFTNNSKFCILDLCPAGGKRLYFSNGTVELLAPKPNPAENYIELEFEVVDDALAELYITDIYGKRVAEISNNRILPGRYNLQYDTGFLPSGTYYVTLLTATNTITHKFIIEK